MRTLFLILCITSFVAHGQALRDINYSYMYSDAHPFQFSFGTVRQPGQWTSYFDIQLNDTTVESSAYAVDFETRKTLYEKNGVPVPADSVHNDNPLSGKVIVPLSDQPLVLVAKVVNTNLSRAWYYYTILEPKHPVVTEITMAGHPVARNYVKVPDHVMVSGSGSRIVSYYDDHFPPAALPHSEKLGAVSKGIKVDSSFVVLAGEPFLLERSGLYLVQQDTMISEGVAFRGEEDYPRFSRLENVAEPFIYICTKQEYAKIREAKNDKKAFDRVILSITRDADRAKTLIRAYFRNVELANKFFTSYKEGWKTDRGMIYIVFGPPQEVFRFNDREVWNYKIYQGKLSFDFVRSPSLFDPENFVLVRNQKYYDTWYEVINLWRNARL